ncbi:MAG: hypothetical protein ACRYGK_07385 [Janthinobacterium lividum]
MKLPLLILAAFAAGCLLTNIVLPVHTANAQDRTQIMLTPKSRFEHVVAGENIWMFDSASNQMIGCHFGGSGGTQLSCDKAKLP